MQTIQPVGILDGDVIRAGTRPPVAGEEIGRVLSGVNALDEATWPGHVPSGSGLVVIRSGFAGEGEEPQPLWLAGPRAEWSRCATHVQGLCAAAGRTPVVWARLGDVLSDAPSLLTFVRSSPAWRFVVEPLGLLTPEMHRNAAEHLERLGELLFGHHACAGVVVGAGKGVPGGSVAALGKVLRGSSAPIWVRRGEESVLGGL